jgi:hypothetical protein
VVGTPSHPSRQATKTKQNQSVKSPIHTTIHRTRVISKQLLTRLPTLVTAATPNPGDGSIGLVL